MGRGFVKDFQTDYIFPASGKMTRGRDHRKERRKQSAAHEKESRKCIYRALESMLEQGLHADLRLEAGTSSNGSKSSAKSGNVDNFKGYVMAHKAVLAAMSPVFKSILSGDADDANEQGGGREGTSCSILGSVSSVTIHEIWSDKALRAFARLIYLGSAELLQNLAWEESLQILAAAHRYDLSTIKAAVSDAVACDLCVSNVLPVMEAAMDACDAWLLAQCKAFVQSHFRDIIRTDAFDDLACRKPSLLVGIVRRRIDSGSVSARFLSFLHSKGFGTASATAPDDYSSHSSSLPEKIIHP